MLRIGVILILVCICPYYLCYSQTKSNVQSPDIIDRKDLRDSILSEQLRMQDSISARLERNQFDTNLTKGFNARKTFFIYDNDGEIIGSYGRRITFGQLKLNDKETNNYFVLDSAHIYITAFNSANMLIWKLDPYTESLLPEYRVKRPLIVNFELGKSPQYLPKVSKVIWISYNNSEYGYLNIETGKYQSMGAD